MRFFKRKQGAAVFDNLGGLAVGVAVLAIALIVAFLIIGQSQTQLDSIQDLDSPRTEASNRSVAYNATVTLQAATSDIPDWVPIVIITSIGAILLGLVTMFRAKR